VTGCESPQHHPLVRSHLLDSQTVVSERRFRKLAAVNPVRTIHLWRLVGTPVSRITGTCSELIRSCNTDLVRLRAAGRYPQLAVLVHPTALLSATSRLKQVQH